MANVLGMEFQGISMPSFGGMSGMGTILIWILIALLICVSIGIGIWLWSQKKLYNKKIVIFENIGNTGYQKTGEDFARLIKVGDGGEEILFLRNRKCYRTAYGKKMGKEIYWFAIGQDGYWYNIVLGDLDAKMGMLDIEPVDRDMRYMHVAIRKNIAERYKKIGFMEKYGTIVANGIFLIIMLVGLWFLIDKLADATSMISQAMQGNKETIEVLKQILGNMDKVQAGGSGYIKA